MPDITSTGAPEVPQEVIDKGKQSQEKRARMQAEEAEKEKAAAKKAAAEAKKWTFGISTFRNSMGAILLSGHCCRGCTISLGLGRSKSMGFIFNVGFRCSAAIT
ncbi:hypothetical protein IFR05_010258 [Cadophora sp. M221]|nr:hypothetical protein IFR05_010258 [Cadophora sp. M221]